MKQIAESRGVAQPGAKGDSIFARFWADFMVGTTHDKNFALMANHYEEHNPDFLSNDFFRQYSKQHEHTLEDFLKSSNQSLESFARPNAEGYMNVIID